MSDDDDEELWYRMCGTVSRMSDVPIEQVKAIAEKAGLSAYSHAGVADLLETVQFELGRKS